MRRTIVLILSAMALATPVAARQQETAERVLAGRVAGPPRSCITRERYDDDSRIFDDGTILYGGPGSTVYLNKPSPCGLLRSDRAILSRTPGTGLCRGDIVEVLDPVTRVTFGACGLGDFVPYTRAKR